MKFFKLSDLRKWESTTDSEALKADWENVGKSLGEVMGLNPSKENKSNSKKKTKAK